MQVQALSKEFVRDVFSAGLDHVASTSNNFFSAEKNSNGVKQRQQAFEIPSKQDTQQTHNIASNLISQILSRGIKQIAGGQCELPNRSDAPFARFVESFVNDVLLVGLNNGQEVIQTIPSEDIRDTIFVTSR